MRAGGRCHLHVLLDGRAVALRGEQVERGTGRVRVLHPPQRGVAVAATATAAVQVPGPPVLNGGEVARQAGNCCEPLGRVEADVHGAEAPRGVPEGRPGPGVEHPERVHDVIDDVHGRVGLVGLTAGGVHALAVVVLVELGDHSDQRRDAPGGNLGVEQVREVHLLVPRERPRRISVEQLNGRVAQRRRTKVVGGKIDISATVHPRAGARVPDRHEQALTFGGRHTSPCHVVGPDDLDPGGRMRRFGPGDVFAGGRRAEQVGQRRVEAELPVDHVGREHCSHHHDQQEAQQSHRRRQAARPTVPEQCHAGQERRGRRAQKDQESHALQGHSNFLPAVAPRHLSDAATHRTLPTSRRCQLLGAAIPWTCADIAPRSFSSRGSARPPCRSGP